MKTAIGYRDGKPFTVRLLWVGKDSHNRDAYLSEAAGASFLRMAEAAALEHVELVINTAFRDHEWQQRLWDNWVRGLTSLRPSKPGYSLHEAGDAIDIDLVDDDGRERPAARWLLQHSSEYGFSRPVGAEPWHHQFNLAVVAKKERET